MFWWLGGAAVTFLAAATMLRAYVSTDAVWFIVGSLALYGVGNLMMVPVMRANGLAVAISVSGILQLVLTTLIAVTVFGEVLTSWQILGIMLGVVAIMLIVFAGASTN